MNKLFFALALLFVGMSANAQHLGTEYRLKRVIPVAGRQGIAIDSNYYYVSDTKVLYKYDKQGNLVMKNDQQQAQTPLPVLIQETKEDHVSILKSLRHKLTRQYCNHVRIRISRYRNRSLHCTRQYPQSG